MQSVCFNSQPLLVSVCCLLEKVTSNLNLVWSLLHQKLIPPVNFTFLCLLMCFILAFWSH